MSLSLEGTEKDTERQRSHVKTEAEIGVTRLQAKGHPNGWRPPGFRERHGADAPSASGRHQPCSPRVSGVRPLDLREDTLCRFKPPSCGAALWEVIRVA